MANLAKPLNIEKGDDVQEKFSKFFTFARIMVKSRKIPIRELKMAALAYTITEEKGFPIVRFQNYCTNETLEGLATKVGNLCDKDKSHLVFDFTSCEVINSLGMAALLETLMIVQDYEGLVVISGLNAIQQKFFGLTGVFSLSTQAENIDKAFEVLQSAQA